MCNLSSSPSLKRLRHFITIRTVVLWPRLADCWFLLQCLLARHPGNCSTALLKVYVEIYKCSQWNASTHIQQAIWWPPAKSIHMPDTHRWARCQYTQLDRARKRVSKSVAKIIRICSSPAGASSQPSPTSLSNNRKSTMTLILALSTVQLSKLCGNLVTEDQCWNYLAIHVAPLTVSQKIWEWKPIWLKWKWCSSSSFFDEIATRASSISQKEKHKVGSQL